MRIDLFYARAAIVNPETSVMRENIAFSLAILSGRSSRFNRDCLSVSFCLLSSFYSMLYSFFFISHYGLANYACGNEVRRKMCIRWQNEREEETTARGNVGVPNSNSKDSEYKLIGHFFLLLITPHSNASERVQTGSRGTKQLAFRVPTNPSNWSSALWRPRALSFPPLPQFLPICTWFKQSNNDVSGCLLAGQQLTYTF